MKNFLLGILFLIVPALTYAQFATVQVIHNSPDAAAATVDIYANGVMLLNDVDFRTASTFVQVPAGVSIQLDIAPGNSTSSANAVYTTNVTFMSSTTYVVVADGILSASGYNPGNTGASAFGLQVYNMGQVTSGNLTEVDVLVHHGATDAPAVDIVEVSGMNPTTLVNNASYTDFAGYLTLSATTDYRVEVRPAGATTAVGSFEVPFSTLNLGGSAVTVLASGFLDPSQNSNGPAFGLWVALPTGGPLVELPASTARAQVIHNSADAAAASVDVYLGGDLLLNDFDFRTASPFVDVPAGVGITLAVAPANSTSVADAIATFNYTLGADETYIIVADGIVSTSGYNPGAGGIAAFGLEVYNMGRETANNATEVDVLVHHGATDAPAVDVVEVSGMTTTNLVTNASYTDFAGYLSLPTADYRVEVRATGASTAVGSYEVPLSTLALAGNAITVVASGFLDPSQNSNGEEFGLWVALPTGGPLVELPASMARAQVIHNSADAAAASVDVYLGGDLLLNDFDFRTASPFVDVPAGVGITLAVAPANSTSVADAIATFNYTLGADETYIIVADGIVSTSGYNPGAGGIAAFSLEVYNMGRETAINPAEVDVLVHHGATDAPTVDVVEVSGTNPLNLVSGASYKDFAGYLNLPATDYRVEVRAAGASTAVGSYEVPLSTLNLAGNAITVVASGFLDPTQNSNGEEFGLWVALPTGGALIELPPSTARAQVIHNSADAAAASVDVYLGNDLLLNDFDFRTASPFVDVPAGVGINLAVAPANSTSVADAIATFGYTLEANTTYVIVADGIVSATGYNPGSTGTAAFGLEVYNMGRETANNPSEVDVLVHHGATDAPAVDVVNVTNGANTNLVTNASYKDFAGYLSLATTDYRLEVRPTGTATAVGSYEAPLATLNLAGEAAVIVASGFLDPTQNSNGEDFGLWMALPAGGPLVELPITTTKAQVIHNSADAAAATVDVYLGNDLLINDFAFRTASTFVDVPANVSIALAVAPGNSTSVADAIATFNYTLDPDRTYIIVADGIISASGYNPGNTGVSAFDLKVYDQARETSVGTDVDVLVHHGATDAATVDVVPAGTTTPLVDDISYGEFDGYLSLAKQAYELNLTNAAGTSVIETYMAPLDTNIIGNSAITIVASGFLDPAQNSNGEKFGLWMSTNLGGPLVQLPEKTNSITTLQHGISGLEVSIAPNPVVSNNLNLNSTATQEVMTWIEVIDLQGKVVLTLPQTLLSEGEQVHYFNLKNVPNGSYILRLSTEEQSTAIPFTVVK